MSELEITSDVLDAEPVPDHESDLAAITDLIAGDSPETDQPGGDAPQPEPDPADLETDTPPEPEPGSDDTPPGIDYDLVIPMPDGAESVTLGQLKDHYQQNSEFHEQRETWENHRMTQDNQQLAARQVLTELASLLGDVKPEALKYVQNMQQQDQAAQAQQLLQVFPEWVDPEVKAKARPALVQTMKQYGYTEAEFAHIQDHRQIKALSDLTRLLAKEQAGAAQREKIKAELPKGQKTVPRKQTSAQKQREMVKRAQDGSESEKLTAIGALIDGA